MTATIDSYLLLQLKRLDYLFDFILETFRYHFKRPNLPFNGPF